MLDQTKTLVTEPFPYAREHSRTLAVEFALDDLRIMPQFDAERKANVMRLKFGDIVMCDGRSARNSMCHME